MRLDLDWRKVTPTEGGVNPLKQLSPKTKQKFSKQDMVTNERKRGQLLAEIKRSTGGSTGGKASEEENKGPGLAGAGEGGAHRKTV